MRQKFQKLGTTVDQHARLVAIQTRLKGCTGQTRTLMAVYDWVCDQAEIALDDEASFLQPRGESTDVAF